MSKFMIVILTSDLCDVDPGAVKWHLRESPEGYQSISLHMRHDEKCQHSG